ncbi:MAG: OmpA family protein [Chitinophagales bacterium]|jgi:outer membrane protein OmpA-like peptidoglycan-associated protein/tetratricopeptide (TPR) repeat protein|nr:OmpA family protein [Chitinophagales bacterium]
MILKITKLCFLLFTLSIFLIGNAQFQAFKSTDKKRAQLNQELIKHKNVGYSQLITFAKKLENQGSYVNAVEYYLLAQKQKPDNKFVLQKLSYLNFELRDYIASKEWTEKLLDVDQNFDEDAKVRLAMCHKATGDFKKATTVLDQLLTQKRKRNDFQILENEQKGAKLGLEIRDKTDLNYDVVNIKQLNGNLQEYAPQPLANNNIIFSALLSDTALNVTKLKEQGADYTSKLIFSHYDEQRDFWSKPELLPIEINEPEVHIGNGFLDKSGKYLYFTKCQENEKLEMKCKLFLAEKKDDKWSVEELKTLNSKGTTNTQPAIMDDSSGKFLLFVSDRPGGKGKLDIWYNKLEPNGRPSKESVNLSALNSFNDDVTPFYHTETKTLYFSSNGYPNLGGFDVFKVSGNLKKWDKIINLKYPFNSTVDDIYFKIDDKGEGFLVSNRDGSRSPRGATCCDDLWRVKVKSYDLWVKGYFVSSKDSAGAKKLLGVSAIMSDSNYKSLYNNTMTDSFFMVKVKANKEYKVLGELSGYYPSMTNFRTPIQLFRNDTIVKLFVMEPIEKKRYVVENIYYAFDKSVVRDDYNQILDSVVSLMYQFPDAFLRIDGHTDARGTEEYNQALSERRCKAAAEYILLKGVEPERMIMRGYNESVPIAPNVTPSGEDDPAGRAKNRRVEFKILNDTGKPAEITDLEYRVNVPFNND